jgi:DNA invertase Pin-like site-specific DNA recombinase
MAREATTALAYFRTSSAANVGGDSLERQRIAVTGYAKAQGLEVVGEFYDAAVSGADHIGERAGFAAMLARIEGNGVRVVLVEDASRFARDLAVQLAGHDLLRRLGVELVAVNAPDHFRDDTPTAVLVRQVLGAISQFEKAQFVAKLKGARDRASRAAGRRVEGRKGHVRGENADTLRALVRKLHRRSPKTGQRLSLREIAAKLAEAGHVTSAGRPFSAEQVKRLLAARPAAANGGAA